MCMLWSKWLCIDPPEINECTTGSHNCYSTDHCLNTLGSFTCTCPSGYVLSGNGYSCFGIYIYTLYIFFLHTLQNTYIYTYMYLTTYQPTYISDYNDCWLCSLGSILHAIQIATSAVQARIIALVLIIASTPLAVLSATAHLGTQNRLMATLAQVWHFSFSSIRGIWLKDHILHYRY